MPEEKPFKKDDFEFIKCNLCGRDETKLLIKRGSSPSSVVFCRQCGLIYRNPRICRSKIFELYQNSTFEAIDDKTLSQARKPVYKQILNNITRYVKKGNILDVGCGYGHFLKMAKDNGWNVFGIELSKEASNFAKDALGINNVSNLPLKGAAFSEGFFDVVTLINTLDFFPDPIGELKEISRILKKEGLLVIRVPNARFTIFAYRLYLIFKNFFKKEPVGFQCYLFTSKTLKQLLEKSKFRIVKLENSTFTSGDPYSIFRNLNKPLKKAVYIFIAFFAAVIYHLTSKHYLIGSSIEIYAQPKKNGKN